MALSSSTRRSLLEHRTPTDHHEPKRALKPHLHPLQNLFKTAHWRTLSCYSHSCRYYSLINQLLFKWIMLLCFCLSDVRLFLVGYCQWIWRIISQNQTDLEWISFLIEAMNELLSVLFVVVREGLEEIKLDDYSCIKWFKLCIREL